MDSTVSRGCVCQFVERRALREPVNVFGPHPRPRPRIPARIDREEITRSEVPGTPANVRCPATRGVQGRWSGDVRDEFLEEKKKESFWAPPPSPTQSGRDRPSGDFHGAKSLTRSRNSRKKKKVSGPHPLDREFRPRIDRVNDFLGVLEAKIFENSFRPHHRPRIPASDRPRGEFLGAKSPGPP